MLKEGSVLLLMVAPLLYLAAIWTQLPETLPMHYNMAGEVDRYGGKAEIWIPVVLVVLPIYLIMLVVPRTEKKEHTGMQWRQTYWRLRLFLQACLSGVAAWIVFSVHQPGRIDPTLGLGIFLSVLFIGLGWIMPAGQSPSAFQIRTPWTANNPSLEQRIRQMTRKIWMFGGLAGIPIVFGLPASGRTPFALLWIVMLSMAPVVLSWRYSRASV